MEEKRNPKSLRRCFPLGGPYKYYLHSLHARKSGYISKFINFVIMESNNESLSIRGRGVRFLNM